MFTRIIFGFLIYSIIICLIILFLLENFSFDDSVANLLFLIAIFV